MFLLVLHYESGRISFERILKNCILSFGRIFCISSGRTIFNFIYFNWAHLYTGIRNQGKYNVHIFIDL